MAANMMKIQELEEILRQLEHKLYVMDNSDSGLRQHILAEIRSYDRAVLKLKNEENIRAMNRGRDPPFPSIAPGGAKHLPEAKSMRAENKMFYFDFGANRRGSYLRLSEVRPNFRSAVTLPMKSLKELRDIISEFADFAESSDDADAPAAEAPAENGKA